MSSKTFNNTKINVEFDEDYQSRTNINSGENISTLFAKIRRFILDLKAVAFSGSYNDLSDKPTTATTETDGLMSAKDKSKLDNADNKYALKSKYGDTTINVGRKAGTDVGARSTAEGYGNTANGNYSHAEGEFTTASGGYSHAEGIHTTASGEMSHAEGNDTTASGANSHAEGVETTASGLASHAGGRGTKALHDNEVAYGKYNESKDDTVFSVGDGTADDARHNAFEITTKGGKLHDKDIATTDLIPTSLPANGGNADTVGGIKASDIYTSVNKPYVTGSATVAANTNICESNHGFIPSAVIWWDGNDSGVATWFNETQFAIKITSSVDRTINYLIFK